MNKEYNLKLDLQFKCNNSKMIFDEFDENTSDFFMQINRQGQEVDISNAMPALLVLKPSGVAVSQILNVKDNLVYGNLNSSLKNEVGTYIAKLMLVEGDKKTFISNISYEVTENALLGKIDNDIVEDERYSVLLQLLERLSNIELQEQTRIDNENSRVEAENLRQESMEKIKNDIDFLINETNKKVNDNLNSNTSKIDNLTIDTKEELNKYKENKDKFINEDLEEFKENTNKSIDDYKAFKDVEINNSLNTYKTNTTNDINSFKNTINSEINKYKNDKDQAINEHIEAKELELDNYVEAKNKEIDEYKTSKNNELDLYVSEKNTLIDSKISEVDTAKEQLQSSVNNKLVEVDNAENQRQEEHEERQQFLNGFEGKLNTVVDDVADIKDDVVSVREANKRQDVFLQGLYNENLDGRVTVKEEGSVISLTNSDDGLVDIIGLEGNTLVNYCTDGAKEVTLNGNIEAEGISVILSDTVDNGLVDVMCEGNTLILDENGNEVETGTEGATLVSVGQDDKNGHKIEILSTNSDNTLSNKKEITLSEPLRALQNGVKDKVVKIGGKWYVERNCGEIVLDGNEQWMKSGSTRTEHFRAYWGEHNWYKQQTPTFNNILPNESVNIQGRDVEGVYITNTFDIQVSHSRLSTVDIEGFKQWLSQNPITVIYQLNAPIYEPIETDISLLTYLDTTYISNNSTIPCNMRIKNTGYSAIIKPSTQYTVAFDTNTSGEVGINLAGSKVITNNNVATITTPSTLTDDSLRLYGKGVKASKVRLLEGDKTNWIPSYFEGMKSCFEDKLQEDGTYKMEILSNNKNFFNKNNAKKTDKWLRGPYNSFKIQLKPNTTYNIRANYKTDKSRQLGLFEEPYAWSKPLWTHSWNNNTSGLLKGWFVSPKDGVCYISVHNESITEENLEYLFDSVYSDLTIQEEKYGYEPFENQSNKIQFSSIEPLRGVGDVKDRFVFKDGKLMIERNIGEVTIKDTLLSTSKQNDTNRIYTTRFILDKRLFPNIKTITNFKSDRFKTSGWDKDEEGLKVGSNIDFKILNARLSSLDVVGLLEWFNNNLTKVAYILNEPTYEEIPFELQKIILEGYKNGTLFFDTNIPVTVTTSYTANIPVVSKLNKVNETTETNTEDIAITQMAVDFLLMSTLGEEMLNFKVRSGYNMASYFASRIIKGALKYEDVINKYPQYKEDINLILISEGHSDLIVEL